MVYLSRLLEWLFADSNQDDGMGSQTISRSSFDVVYHVLAGREVNKRRGAELSGHLLFLVTSVNCDYAEAHRSCVLNSQRTKSTACTDDGDGLAGSGVGLLQSLVDGDAGAENGRNGLQITFLGDTGNVSRFGDAVLLESAVDGVAGQEGFCAERLVGSLAEVARQARTVDPLRRMLSVQSGTKHTESVIPLHRRNHRFRHREPGFHGQR